MNASSHTATTPIAAKRESSWFVRMFRSSKRRLTKKTKEVFPFLPINDADEMEEYHNPILGIDEQYLTK